MSRMSDSESSSQAIQRALEKRSRAEYEFIVLEQSSMVEDLVSTMQKQQQGQQQQQQQEAIYTEVLESLLSASERDKVHVRGMEESVATHIKHQALSIYGFYQNLSEDEKSIVDMGLNSILDLTEQHPRGQGSLFTAKQHKELLGRFSHYTTSTNIEPELNEKLMQLEKVASGGNLAAALKKAQLQKANAIDRAEKIAFHLYSHALELLIEHPYLFDGQVDLSELDYAVKCWTSVFEYLMATTAVRCKWGGAVCTLHAGNFKVDLRIVNDHARCEYGVSQGELAKENTRNVKFSDGHAKVLLEGKQLVDTFRQHHHCDLSANVIQLWGPKIQFMDVNVVADGLYVATTVGRFVWPSKCNQLHLLRPMYSALMTFRQQVQRQAEVVNGSERKRTKKDKQVAGVTRSNKEGPDTVSWCRGTWMVPRNGAQTLPPPPRRLFHQ